MVLDWHLADGPSCETIEMVFSQTHAEDPNLKVGENEKLNC